MSEKMVKLSGIDILLAARQAYDERKWQTGDHLAGLVVDGLKNFARQGRADQAIACELMLYRLLVKYKESENSVEEYFSKWRDTLYDLGRGYRDESLFSEGCGVGIVFQTFYPLAHVEVVYNTLKLSRPANIYVIGGYTQRIVDDFRNIGCKVELLVDHFAGRKSIVERLRYVRERMAADGVGVAVWNSTPSCSSFAFGMGLARLQVMWSHRYHAHIPGADLYLCSGENGVREYHGRRWTAIKTPLVDWEAIRNAPREEKPEGFVFGTIARHEKMEEEPFLYAVSEILKACPEAHYDFCGRIVPEATRAYFLKAGVWARCHFAGWIDPAPYVTRLDCLLETFPLGGICALYAAARDVPVVAKQSNYNPLTHNGYPVVETTQLYIQDAIKMYRDAGHRDKRVEEGRRMIEREIAIAHAGAARFHDTLDQLQLAATDG